MTVGERLYALLLHGYRREFRDRYGDDLRAFFRQDRDHPRYGAGPMRPLRFWWATMRDLVRSVWRHRLGLDDRTPTAGARRRRPSLTSRLRADVVSGWRGLRTSRGVTVAALSVLTLGIGTSTAIFSVVDAVALRGLPFPDQGRLVSVAETDLRSQSGPISAAYQNYAEWRSRQRVFEDLAGTSRIAPVTTAGPVVETLRPVRITASLFDVLRTAPALGRPFRADDERVGAPKVVILSDGLWRRRFNARPDVVGQMLTLENGAWEIVGVMPPDFVWPIGSIVTSTVDYWTPFVPTDRDILREGVGRNYNQTVVARLRPGVSVAQASAQMVQIRDALAIQFPRWFIDRGVIVQPLQEAIVGSKVRAWMLFLLGSVACVLLIACLNVANLLLARAVSRNREVAVRAALGASPWDLARSLIVESVMLSGAGTVLGVLVSFWGVKVLRATLPDHLPRLANIAVDLRVLAVAAIAAVATGVLFGTLPALQFSRPDVSNVLGQGGRSQTGGATGQRIRTALVMAEVALAVVLLAGAGLFISSFARVVSIDLGFNPEQVVAIGVSPRGPRATPQERAQLAVNNQALIAAAVERVQAVPGVVAASALSSGLPLSGTYMTVPVKLPGRDAPFGHDDDAWVHGVSPAYLDVMRQTLVAGRWVSATDTPGSPPVVVLSDEAARRYFGTASPLGQTILMDDAPRTVVGVVRGARTGGPETALAPEAYIPFVQSDQVSAEIVFRSALDSPAIVPAARAAIEAVVPASAVSKAETVNGYFAALIAQRKFNMIVLALFGALAILIAAVGLYGLMAFLVAHRTREIGLRMALGAVPSGIVHMVLGRAAWLIAVGLVAGLSGAVALERLVRTFLFDARSYDPLVYGSVAALLLVTGLAAAFGPARRAARIDPLVALRAE